MLVDSGVDVDGLDVDGQWSMGGGRWAMVDKNCEMEKRYVLMVDGVWVPVRCGFIIKAGPGTDGQFEMELLTDPDHYTGFTRGFFNYEYLVTIMIMLYCRV